MLAIERRGFAANLGAGRKAPCRAATTGPVTLFGEQTVDGVAVVADDRVLVKDQANGYGAVYVCKTSDWQLASDFNQRGDVVKGSLVFVTDGTANGLKDWYVTTSGRPWPGREAISFARFNPPISPGSAVWAGGQAYTLTPNDSSAATKTANTAAIQAAIDYAYANGLQTVNIAAGAFHCDPGIYVDAPGNLRSSVSTPTVFNFSLRLQGVGGLGNHEGHGTWLRFTDNSTTAIYIGTGQGMSAGGFTVSGPSGATSRAALSTNGVGIALSGGNGGLSRAELDDVMVENFRAGITTGANNEALCDSLTFRNVHVRQCYRGLSVSGTQNYIINLEGTCVFSDCTQDIYSPLGKAVNVRGGNYSTTDAKKNAFTVGSTSALTSTSDSFAGSSFTNWTFTTTLASDDQPMIDGAYDAFAVLLTGFGVVPLVLTNYNSGTRIATFKFYVGWLTSHYPGVDIKSTTDIETELQAATLLYACETVTPFFGTGINVDGPHVENPAVLTRLITTETAVQGERTSRISKLFCNYPINHADIASGTNAQKAVFYCQQVFPFIRVVQSSVIIEDPMLVVDPYVGAGADGVNVEVVGNTAAYRLVVKDRGRGFFHPNITTPLWGPNSSDNDYLWPTMLRGAGEWDSTPFLPGAEATQYYAANRISSVPFRGWRPSPDVRPAIKRSVFDAIAVGPGSLGTYPSLYGQTDYSLYDESTLGPSASVVARSGHFGGSYGQNLTLTWSYKGKTHVVTLSALTRMYAGLKVTLDNGGGDKSYIVTGVYPTLGYITVVNITDGADQLLAGTKTTTYTDATVKQESYSIGRVGNLPASKFTTNSSTGATTAAAGDITGADFVNLKLPAVGTNNYTTRTASQMFGDIPGCYTGYKYMLAIANTSTSGTPSIVGGSNVTMAGSTAALTATSVRQYEVRFTSTAAVTIESQL